MEPHTKECNPQSCRLVTRIHLLHTCILLFIPICIFVCQLNNRQTATVLPKPQRLFSSINTYLPEMVDFMDVLNLSTYLVAEDLLTYEERDTILSLRRKHLQVPELLQVLMTKGANWYERFRVALTRASSGNDVHLGHKELLEILPASIATNNTEKQCDHHENVIARRADLEVAPSGCSPPYHTPSEFCFKPCVAPIPSSWMYSHQQMWYQRSGCLCSTPPSPSALNCDIRAQIASSCSNASAAEYTAYGEGALHHHPERFFSDTQSPGKPNEWSAAFSKQCWGLLTTVKDVESSLVDMSIDRANLLHENRMLREENEKLKAQIELLEESISKEKEGNVQQQKDALRKLANTTVVSTETAVEYLVTQQMLQSAKVNCVASNALLLARIWGA